MKAATAFAILLLGSVPLHAANAEADARLAQEFDRLEQTLKTAEVGALPEDVKSLVAVHRGTLERAKKATSPEYRLYRLRDAFVGIETLAFCAKEAKAGESVETFRKLWDSSRARFEAAAPPSRGGLLQRGLIESATTRAARLYNASLPYSKASAPWSGVYYLGEAEGNLRFREFVAALAGGDRSDAEKPPGRAQLAAMLESLERDTVGFFGNDVTNQAVVPVSVRLKEAHELLDAGRLSGATLLLVEARAALSRRGGPRGKYPPRTTARAGSIVAMLEAWAGDEQAPMSDALREEVVPFYGALYSAKPIANPPRTAQVTVTLVRWPYT